MAQLQFDYDEKTGAVIADKDGLHIHTMIGEETAWLFLSGEIPVEDITLFLEENKDCIQEWNIFGVREDGQRRIFIRLVQNCNIFEFIGLSLLMNLPR